MASTETEIAALEQRIARWLARPRSDVHGEITPEGGLCFRVGEYLLSVSDGGGWVLTAPGETQDVVMVCDEDFEVRWSGIVKRGDTCSN